MTTQTPPAGPGPALNSKSQLKREAAALQKMGERLARLRPGLLARIPLSDELREALLEAQRLRSHGAYRRQLRHIGKLMRSSDAGAIQQALQSIEAASRSSARRFHRLEEWRERLISGEAQALGEFLKAYPHADRQHLCQLIRNAQKERGQDRPPTANRRLFRYLRDLNEDEAVDSSVGPQSLADEVRQPPSPRSER